MDTNEDGFTAANVRAICAVSESSKKLTSEDNSIGEKGIGFKSVFNMARSVHIQSGLWSFRLDNDPEDSLSMFIPIPEYPRPLPEGIRTRIALRYQDEKSAGISRALQALPDSTIMFLRKLTQLRIALRERNEGRLGIVSRNLTKSQEGAISEPILTLKSSTHRSEGADTECAERRYRMFRREYSQMPRDAKRRRQRAEVQLAFPVTAKWQAPLVTREGEYVFAFLPMARQRQIPVRHAKNPPYL